MIEQPFDCNNIDAINRQARMNTPFVWMNRFVQLIRFNVIELDAARVINLKPGGWGIDDPFGEMAFVSGIIPVWGCWKLGLGL